MIESGRRKLLRVSLPCLANLYVEKTVAWYNECGQARA
jgi:hypothetical protein